MSGLKKFRKNLPRGKSYHWRGLKEFVDAYSLKKEFLSLLDAQRDHRLVRRSTLEQVNICEWFDWKVALFDGLMRCRAGYNCLASKNNVGDGLVDSGGRRALICDVYDARGRGFVGVDGDAFDPALPDDLENEARGGRGQGGEVEACAHEPQSIEKKPRRLMIIL